MPANPPENMPRITPYLLYRDVASILDWLGRTFDFKERMRMPGPDGTITHAEMELADGVIMMGSPGPEYQNPMTGMLTGDVRKSFSANRVSASWLDLTPSSFSSLVIQNVKTRFRIR